MLLLRSKSPYIPMDESRGVTEIIGNSRKGRKSVEAFRIMLARSGVPRFTPDHLAYLETLGVCLPDNFPCYPQWTFWFEEQGLMPEGNSPARDKRGVPSRR